METRKRHFAGARGGLRGHQIGDVGAGDQQHQGDQDGERDERAAVILLQARGAGGGGFEHDRLIEEPVDVLLRHAGEAFGAVLFPGARGGVQLGAHRFEGDAGVEKREGAMPGPIVVDAAGCIMVGRKMSVTAPVSVPVKGSGPTPTIS